VPIEVVLENASTKELRDILIPLYSCNLLHRALNSRHLAGARWLLEGGPDGMAPNEDGILPLVRAVQENDVEIASLLIKFGADPTVMSVEGRPLIQWAIENGREEIVDLMLQQQKEARRRSSRMQPLQEENQSRRRVRRR
jgi:ankyrin repeat protein